MEKPSPLFISIHASVRKRLAGNLKILFVNLISIHASVRKRLYRRGNGEQMAEISIHASVRKRHFVAGVTSPPPPISIHASVRKRPGEGRFLCGDRQHFNPRFREEATAFLFPARFFPVISIHASVRKRLRGWIGRLRTRKFQSTLP